MNIDKNKAYIVGIGGANVDFCAKLAAMPIPKDSNPCELGTAMGGVARNVLENLAHLNAQVLMLTALGSDANGRLLKEACSRENIDMSEVFISPDYPTGSYMATLGTDGEMLLAACDARIIENIPLSYFKEKQNIIKGAKAVLCDPNLTSAQLQEIINIAEGSKIFLDPVSCTKAERIRPILGKLYFLKPNRMELEELSGISCATKEGIVNASAKLLNQGLYSLAVSLSEEGCYYADKSGKSFFRKLNHGFRVVNATGAGDAFMAGFINGFAQGLSPEKCVDMGLCCGAAGVMSPDTVNKELNSAKLQEYMEKYAER